MRASCKAIVIPFAMIQEISRGSPVAMADFLEINCFPAVSPEKNGQDNGQSNGSDTHRIKIIRDLMSFR